MAKLEVLSNAASRRGVLRTGVKVAYATPLVLATMKAAPVFAQDIQADFSEDKYAETALENIGFQAISTANSAIVDTLLLTQPVTAQEITNLQNAISTTQQELVVFNNDYQAIITQVGQAGVSTSQQVGSKLVDAGGNNVSTVTIPAAGAVTATTLTAASTVQDLINAYNAYYGALNTALTNLNNAAGTAGYIAAKNAYDTAHDSFTETEDIVETTLLLLAESTQL